MKKIARSLRDHRELILNYVRAQKLLSSGVVEGLNNKAKVTMRKSYGFRTYRVLELALYHSLGKLPEPDSTHDSSDDPTLKAGPRLGKAVWRTTRPCSFQILCPSLKLSAFAMGTFEAMLPCDRRSLTGCSPGIVRRPRSSRANSAGARLQRIPARGV
jgi:hypothetical protein